MKNIILTLIVFFAAICLPILDARAQNVTIECISTSGIVSKAGGTCVMKFLFRGLSGFSDFANPEINSLEGGDYSFMTVQSFLYMGRDPYGYIYELKINFKPAVDFGYINTYPTQITFDLDYGDYYNLDCQLQQYGLDLGSISPSEQSIYLGQKPQTLTYSSNDAASIKSVQWMQRTASGGGRRIDGANGYSYSPGILFESTEFWVFVTSRSNGSQHSEPVVVNVSTRFEPGAISGGQTIILGHNPAVIKSLSPASGGMYPITYQWESSRDKQTWESIWDATSEDYQPSALTATTYFRRRARSGDEFKYSNVTAVSVKSPIDKDLSFMPIANVVSEKELDSRSQGLKTYEKVAMLGDNAAAGAFIERAFYYDYRGRVIQTVEKNHLGGVSRYSTKYDFSGNILKNHEQHTSEAGGNGDQKLTVCTYDHRGRLMTETTTLNNGAAEVVSCDYNDLGQLVGKTANAGQLKTSLAYNIQGWQTGQEVVKGADILFRTQLRYYNPQFPNTSASYTGNISEWEWQQNGSRIGNPEINTYAFTYDKLARLTETKQYINSVPNDQFVEKGLKYDRSSNLCSIDRTQAGNLASAFRYTYTGNQLTMLSDSLANQQYSYTCDLNGNMEKDGANDLTLKYNHLNLIEKVERNNATVANYSYLADGTKIAATNALGDGLVYAGSLIYRKQEGALTLESTGFGAGRFTAMSGSNGTVYMPDYFITDHLGSVRTVLNAGGDPEEQNNYYPFGMRWGDSLQQLTDNRYLFNGKETQEFVDVPYTDYGARQYDSRYRLQWNSVDVNAESYFPTGTQVFLPE